MFKSLLLKGRVLCLLLCCMVSSLVVTAQTKHTGRVIGSDDKLPIVGATVRVKGTTIGTQTDVNGQYTLNLSPGNVLVVSYLGYQSTEVTVGNSETVNVTLQVGNNALNEVVVTGYTSQRKKDISGAVATVDVASAIKVPASGTDQLLQGQAAGVTVITQGAPGAGAQITVRGLGNFGNSSPLVVIDGVQDGNLNNVNPNDIESITVLKDAGSAAIYGVRGGNGVIIVTTKKGKQGKSVFTYDAYYGTQRPMGGNPFNVLNGADYLKLVKQVEPNSTLFTANGSIADFGAQGSFQGNGVKGNFAAGSPEVDASRYKFDEFNQANDYLIQKYNNTTGTDWFHEIFKPANMQSHTVSASGGNDKNTYYASFGYLNQQGTLINSYFKRAQTRINTAFNIKEHFRIGENATLFYTLSPNGQGGIPSGNQNEGNAISQTYRIQPQIPVYDISGTQFAGTWAGPTSLGNSSNPVAIQYRQRNNESRTWNMEGTVFAEADFLKHFLVRTAFSGHIDNFDNFNITYRPYDSGEGHANANGYAENAGYNNYYNWTNTASYNQIFGKHSVKLLLGYEQRQYSGRGIGTSVGNLPSLDPAFVNIGAGSEVNNRYSYIGQPNALQSFFTRLDYIFNDRYILGATLRRDNSSRFAPSQRVGYFPSVSAAWRISQEDFMKGTTWVNDLKLRGSYGELGFQENVPGNNAATLFALDRASSFYAIDGSNNNITQGFFNSQLGNRSTTWERNKILNFGFDVTMFNKLDVTAEYYKKTTSGLLFPVTLPATVGGASAPFVNVGEVQNKGFDVAVTYRDKITSDLSFNLGVNVTTVKNEVTYLQNNYTDLFLRFGAVVKQQVGMPIGSFYGYKVVGYFRDAADVAASPTQDGAGEGRFKYADIDGDNKITDNDRTFYGKGTPDFTYGVNLGLNYKGFDFSTTLYGSQGNDIFNYVKYWTNFYSSLTGNKSNDLLFNSWTPTNLNPKAPKLEAVNNFSTSGVANSYYVENGSFLKMRSAQLGYTFGSGPLKSIGVDKLNVYVQGVNLFTITGYSGMDPELQSAGAQAAGVDQGNYPNNEKRYILGVRLSF